MQKVEADERFFAQLLSRPVDDTTTTAAGRGAAVGDCINIWTPIHGGWRVFARAAAEWGFVIDARRDKSSSPAGGRYSARIAHKELGTAS